MKTNLIFEEVEREDSLEFLFGLKSSVEDSESLKTWEEENEEYTKDFLSEELFSEYWTCIGQA